MFSSDLFKFKKSFSAKIMALVCIASAVLFGLALSFVSRAVYVSDGPSQTFTGAKAMFAFASALNAVIVCISIFAGLFTASEFDRGSIRNSLSSGVARTKYFFSKFFTNVIFAIIVTILSAAGFVATVTAINGWGELFIEQFFGKFLIYFLIALVNVLSYSALFTMLAFLIRSPGGVIGIGIAWATIAEGLIAMLLPIAKVKFLTTLSENLPGIILSGLQNFAENDKILTASFAQNLIAPAIIIAISLFVSLFDFNKHDIK